ncbi:HIT family protein [Candidatus Nomurabacteria bacterium]|nr:HIT family protein [Candidatus Nomurabacteria bacterium]
MSIFSKILAGEIPAEIVYKSPDAFAIMDIYPSAVGHVLLMPVKPYPNYLEMPEQEYAKIMLLARNMAKLLKQAYQADFVILKIIGTDVTDHLHIHLIPIYQGQARLDQDKPVALEDLKPEADKIREALKEL